jgi:hypothetical protein
VFYFCLFDVRPENCLEKFKTFWSFSGLYVNVCVVIFVYLWVESVKSHYHALLQTKLPKTFRLLL